MSKGLGQKIAIKFTKNLIEDISNNVDAFSVTGKERKYIGGEFIDGDYQVDSISEYPPVVLYDCDFNNGSTVGINIFNGGIKLSEVGD